jgi:hypothetical protein
MPPQDRARGNQEDRPAPARKHAAQRRKDPAIGGPEFGPLDLAAQHLELVAQDGDLDVLGVLAVEAPEQQAEEPARHEVEER